MITHIRDEEKAGVEKLILRYTEVVDEFTTLQSDYANVKESSFNGMQLGKLLRKGRLNMVEGKTLVLARYKDAANEMVMHVCVKPNPEGALSIHTHIISYIDGQGHSEVNVYDSLEIASIQSLVMRILYSLSEMTLRSVATNATDTQVLAEAKELAEKLHWGEHLDSEVVAELLEKTEENLDIQAIAGKEREKNEEDTYVKAISFDASLLMQYKKYRSTKELVRIDSHFKGHDVVDSLIIDKDPTTDKFMYILNVTKIEEYKGKLDIAHVEERREVSEQNYVHVLNDMLNVLTHLAGERNIPNA